MTEAPVRALRARLRALRNPVVVSSRLALTLPTRRRAAELVRLMDDPSVARWTLHVPYPYRVRDARAWLVRAPAARRAGRDVTFHLVRRSDGALVGGVGLHHLDPANARAELGYWVGRPYRRQGYATEATRALTAFAFRKLGLHRVEARVFPGNVASSAVLRTTGFRREGRLRESVVKDGRFRDEVVYALFANAASPSRRSRVRRAAVRPRHPRRPGGPPRIGSRRTSVRSRRGGNRRDRRAG